MGFPLKIDSDFWQTHTSCRNAVSASRGLVVDGIVGPKTWGGIAYPTTPAIKMGYVRIVGDINETRGQTLVRELQAVGHQAEWVEVEG